ncbi:MAG: hypothetical protein JO273_24800 [Methylobacteriaceae bacterium]|nr:hypothetical protein [Methylobacteriaceae bacterium]MBV9634919.1 hypothetical protein [Methylobacteriaceae bacterium]
MQGLVVVAIGIIAGAIATLFRPSTRALVENIIVGIFGSVIIPLIAELLALHVRLGQGGEPGFQGHALGAGGGAVAALLITYQARDLFFPRSWGIGDRRGGARRTEKETTSG